MFDFAKSEKLKPTDLKPSEPTKTSSEKVMKKYIDADKLCEGLRGMASVLAPFKRNTIFGVIETIKIMHAADVEEVKHGQWIEVDDGVLIGNGKHIECSECGTWRKDKQKLNYCPNCGAKMDGDSK